MLVSRSWEIALLSSWGQGSHKADTQCNGRSDGTRVPCYKSPLYAPSSSTQLVTRERDFGPRNAGAARKSQAFRLERELPAHPLRNGRVRAGTGSRIDRKRIRDGKRLDGAAARKRNISLNNLTTIVRGICDSSFATEPHTRHCYELQQLRNHMENENGRGKMS